jgi:hypothetical protein
MVRSTCHILISDTWPKKLCRWLIRFTGITRILISEPH